MTAGPEPSRRTEPTATEREQATALQSARRRATGLLAIVGLAFLASSWLPETAGTDWLRAGLEAGLVGGLADWFAVVALFRHPLGVPIPHTAVIPRSKDGLGANLATFVEENFLATDHLDDRLADPAHVERLGAWLADRANADRVAGELLSIVGTAMDAMDREALVERLVLVLRRRVDEVPISRLAGASLESAVSQHRHRELVTATIEGIRESITANRRVLRQRLGEQSPSWVPPVVDDLVFDRAEHVARTFLGQIAQDEDHELRRALDEQLLRLTRRMQDDQVVQDRVATAARDALDDDRLRGWVSTWWDEIRDRVEAAAAPDAGDRALRRLAADGVQQFGTRLGEPGEVHDRAVAALRDVAPRVAGFARTEVGGLIESTVERWDAQDTSRRLELWMGRDLQFVRINGTVVGALVGLVLHGIGLVLA